MRSGAGDRQHRAGKHRIAHQWGLLVSCCLAIGGCESNHRPPLPITRSGTIVAATQASLDSLDGVQVIDGSLIIGRPDVYPSADPVRDLSPLRRLEVVTYKLAIERTDSLRSLAPLCELRRVGVILDIAWNANITTLAPLRNVRQVGRQVSIVENPRLRTLDGLQGLTELRGTSLYVGVNDSLQSLAGLDSLRSQSALPGYNMPRIEIWNNRKLQDLSALQGLLSAGDISIRGDSTLASIAGLRNLRRAAGLLIGECPLVEDISVLAGLDSLGWINLQYCPIADLGPLRDVAVGDLALYGLPVSTLPAFSRVTSLGALCLERNNRLTSLAGLDSVRQLGRLSVVKNDALTSLTGLGRVRGLEIVEFSGNIELCTSAIISWLNSVSVLYPPTVENNGGCR